MRETGLAGRRKLPTIRDIPGHDDREELAQIMRHAAERFNEITTTDARAWGLEASAALSDVIAAVIPLADSAMAVAVLAGANTVEVADMAQISYHQVARRIANAPEFEHYAVSGTRSTSRVDRSGIADARADLAAGVLRYRGEQRGESKRRP